MQARHERPIDRNEVVGKVQTVLGPISPDRLGVTLVHEHLLIDMAVWFEEPKEPDLKAMAYEPVTLKTLGWVRYNPTSNLDNVKLLDEEVATEEAFAYRRAGGGALVDVTNVGIGRDPEALVRIAHATGLHVIMGSGYYVAATHPPDVHTKTEEEIAAQIVQDITQGVGPGAIRAGIIGEIGCSWPVTEDERKVLRASARAQRSTGSPLTIHPGRHESAYLEVIEILGNAGADLSRTVIGHVDRSIFDADRRIKVAEECASKGCWVAYDCFGFESYYPLGLVRQQGIDLPNDRQRIDDISRLIEKGYLDRLVLSHDCCMKMRLCRYGGHGYSHILCNVVPRMRDHGISDDAIHAMLVENPRRLLSFV